jgi:hypothetical protein
MPRDLGQRKLDFWKFDLCGETIDKKEKETDRSYEEKKGLEKGQAKTLENII